MARRPLFFLALLLIFAPLAARAAEGAAPAPEHSVMHFIAFGDIPMVRPMVRPDGATEPAQVVLLLSGDQGIGERERAVADALAAGGALVFEIDAPAYLKAAAAKKKVECLYPGAEFEELSQNGQARAELASYHSPVLAGVGSGASLAYAAFAQAPAGTYAGALSFGFCPVVRPPKELCHGDGLRWDKGWTGGGWRLLPDRKLELPWIVLETPAEPSCPAVSGPDPAAVATARIPAPKDGPEGWKEQLRQGMSLLAEKRKTAEAARVARIGDLADLPVVEIPANGPEKDAFALDLTGSGGYVGFDAEIGRALTGRGVPLVVLSSLDYFWKTREPDGTGRDLARILEHYLAKWHKKKAILVGYSQGADILPFMVKRLPAALRARVGVLGLIGPDASAQFDMGLSSFRKKPAPPELPVVPEIAALQKVKTVCVYGKREKTTICPRLDPRQVDLFLVPGGHAFEGNGEAMVDHFLAAAGLTASSAPAAPAPAGRATPSRRARG